MSLRDELSPIVEEVSLLIAERRAIKARGPHFRIVHRFRARGTDCRPGEEVFVIAFVFRGREYPLRLSLAMLLLFNYLASHSRFPQSASQIELGIRSDDFYRRHTHNAGKRPGFTRLISRSAVKTYIRRIRSALLLAFREAGLHLDPLKVLVTQATVSNQVGYQLRGSFEWIHLDVPDQNPEGYSKNRPAWPVRGQARRAECTKGLARQRRTI